MTWIKKAMTWSQVQTKTMYHATLLCCMLLLTILSAQAWTIDNTFCYPDGPNKCAVRSSTTICLGGQFSNIGEQSHTKIAARNASTTCIAPATPTISASGPTTFCAGGSVTLSVPAQAVMVSTFAGSTSGFADGQRTASKFNGPNGIAIDAAGNVFVADYSNHRIRKIDPTGLVSTIAGSTQGYAEGQGAAAQFNYPAGIAVDAAGNVYVADYLNNRIRKIDPTGLVSTLAGSTPGNANGQGAAAQFTNPNGVALDAAGNVYVADQNNHSIRKITPTGLVSTIAGSTQGYAEGQGAAAQFNLPFNVALDTAGNIYVADALNYRIRKIDPTGMVSTLAGSSDGYAEGQGAAAKFNYPADLVVDPAGNIYVTDPYNNRIRKIDPTGMVSTYTGTSAGYTDGQLTTAKFRSPLGIELDARGNFYVTDRGNEKIRTITQPVAITGYLWSNGATTADLVATTSGSYTVQTIANGCTSAASAPIVVTVATPATPTISAGGPTTFCVGGFVTLTAPAGFSYLWSNGRTNQSIDVFSGRSYTVRTIANGCTSAASDPIEVTVATPGTPTISASGPTTFCSGGSVTLTAPAGFSYLWSTNETTQSINVTASGNYSVRTITSGCASDVSAATVVSVKTTPATPTITASGPTTFCTGGSVTLSASVARTMVSTLAGSTQGATDGLGSAAQFSNPGHMVVDAVGNIYVSEITNHRIRKITPDGQVTTLAGSTFGFADGNGSSAKFNGPSGMAIDQNGNIYVADPGNNRIRIVTPLGRVFTYAGNATKGSSNGQGTAAQFAVPSGVAMDASYNLYVTDFENHLIRKIAPAGHVTTLAGSTQGTADGTGAGAQFSHPYGIAINRDGDLIVSDYGSHRLRKVTPAGVVTTIAGSSQGFADGLGSSAQFNQVGGLTIDADNNIYLADKGNHRIRKITTQGMVSTFVGSTQGMINGNQTIALFDGPTGVAIDHSSNLYVADFNNHLIRSVKSTGYLWSNGDTTESINVTTGGTYTLQTINGTCTSAVSAATVVTVNTQPTTPSISASGPTAICTGGSVTLSAPASFGYLWSTTETSQSINVTASGSYTLQTIANGCTSAVSAATVVTVNTPPSTPTISAGGPTTFTAGGSVTLTAPAGLSYLWSNSATTQSINVTSGGSYTVQTINGTCTSAISAATVVTVNAPTGFVFTGTGTWASTANWSNGTVPTDTDSATIAAGAVLNLTADQTVRSLAILPGATLNFGNDNQLKVTDVFDNQGTVTAVPGQLNALFIGQGGTSRIGLIKGNPLTLNSIVLRGHAKTETNLTLYHSLGLQGFNFNANGKRITLKSTATGTASLVLACGNLVDGQDFVVERYHNPSLATASGAWIWVGAQTAGQNVNVWAQNNPYAAATYTNLNVATGASIYEYDPNYTLSGSNGYKKLSAPTIAAPIGQGFRVWFRTPEFFGTGGATWKTIGAPLITTHTWTLKYCAGSNCASGGNASENGWNLIANPFAATIDWDASNGWVRSDIFNATYIANSKTANTSTYINGVGVNGGSRFIPSGQGFMVWATAANPVLQASVAVISSDVQSFTRAGALSDVLKINIKNSNNLEDQIAIRWDNLATTGLDRKLEAPKMTNPLGVNLAFVNNSGAASTPMAILAEPKPTVTTAYPLALTAPSAGIYTITFEGLASFSNPHWSLYLLDNQTNITTQVTDAASYTFSAVQGANNGRFSLILNPNSVTGLGSAVQNLILMAPNPALHSTTIQLAKPTETATTFSLTNALGQVVITATMPANSTELSIDLSNLAKGVYMVQAPGFGVTKLVRE